jgi:hypothetical protein
MFFIKDRVDGGNIRIEYCPTEIMIADYFTKPLQGQAFKKLKKVIMGYEHIDSLRDDGKFPLKERVGNNERKKDDD